MRWILCLSTAVVLLCSCTQAKESQFYSSVHKNEDTTDLDVCKEICNVKFGSNFRTAKKKLEMKFGSERAYGDNELMLFADKNYGGIEFDFIEFTFQNNGEKAYLNRVAFRINAKDLKDAKLKRDNLCERLKEKYKIVDDIDDNNNKYYLGGTSPTDNDEFGFCIGCEYDDAKTWYAYILYGPYNYVNEEF